MSAKKNAITSLRHVVSEDKIQVLFSTLSLENSLQAISFLMKFDNLLN